MAGWFERLAMQWLFVEKTRLGNALLTGNPEISELGRDTRFTSGNRASVGNRGGRPRKAFSAVLDGYSAKSLAELWRIARDEKWPLRLRLEALRVIATTTTPRRTATELSGAVETPAVTLEVLRRMMEEQDAAGGGASELGAGGS